MKATIALGVVAALLLAFILVYERGTVSSGELQARGPAVLQHFVRDRVTKLEIQQGGETTVLHRAPDLESGFEHGLWRIEAPFDAEADQATVDVLLGELEWMDNRRRFEDVSEADRARFGLDAPRFRLWYTVGDERLLMRVGGETPAGDGVYVEADRAGVVYVIGKDLPEALRHPAGHYHSKDLHDGLMLLASDSLILRGPDGEVRVAKEDGRFRLRSPVRGLVSRSALSEVFQTLDRLQATRYVRAPVPAADTAERARFGLDSPLFEALVRKRSQLDQRPKDGEAFEMVTRHLRLGAACEGHPGESYFMVDDGPVFCVLDGEIAAARKGHTALREPRLLVLDDDEIDQVTLTSADRTLELRSVDPEADPEADPAADAPRTWRLTSSAGKRELQAFEADTTSVAEWLAALRGATVEAFDQGAADGPVAPGALSVRFKRAQEGPDYVLTVGTGGLVRRGDEAQFTRFGPATAELLRPPAAGFRKRLVWSAEGGVLQSLELRSGGSVQRAVRGQDGQYMLEAPRALPADAPTMQELARMLTRLETLRFAADAAAPQHGLSPPAATLVARFGPKPTRQLQLQLGAQAFGSRYARLAGDDAVFVLPPGLAAALAEPLVSRRLLAIPPAEMQGARVKQGAATCAFSREGGVVADTTGFVDTAAAERFVQALGALRAASVAGYAADTPAKLGAGWATVTVDTPAGPRTLRVGPASGEPGRLRHPARRLDVPVEFTLRDADAARLLGCLSAAE